MSVIKYDSVFTQRFKGVLYYCFYTELVDNLSYGHLKRAVLRYACSIGQKKDRGRDLGKVWSTRGEDVYRCLDFYLHLEGV